MAILSYPKLFLPSELGRALTRDEAESNHKVHRAYSKLLADLVAVILNPDGTFVIGSVTTNMLVDGILTADAAGRAKMANGYIIAAKMADDSVVTAAILDLNVTASKLASVLDLSSKTVILPNASVTAAMLVSPLDLSTHTVILPSVAVNNALLVNSVNLSVNSNLVTTTFYTPSIDGLYEIQVLMVVTGIQGDTNNTVTSVIGWTDISGVANTSSPAAAVFTRGAAFGAQTTSGIAVIAAKSGVAITYAVTGTNWGGSAQIRFVFTARLIRTL